jgi:hypothetical protein
MHMGLTPPEIFTRPICTIAQKPTADRVTPPIALLAPKIDGLVTDFFEWRGAGSINPHPPLGAMWKSEGIFTAILFGWSLDHLFLRLDPDDTSQERQSGMVVEVSLQCPQQTFRLSLSLAPSGADHYTLSRGTSPDSWQVIGPYHSIARQRVLELGVPIKDLGLEQGQEVQLSLVVLEHSLEVARYPHHNPATLVVPGSEFDAAMWRV